GSGTIGYTQEKGPRPLQGLTMSALQARVTGTLLPDGTLRLDEKPNLPPGRVQVLLHREEPESPASPGLPKTLEDIHRGQQARGFQWVDQATLDARLQALRDEPDCAANRTQGHS